MNQKFLTLFLGFYLFFSVSFPVLSAEEKENEKESPLGLPPEGKTTIAEEIELEPKKKKKNDKKQNSTKKQKKKFYFIFRSRVCHVPKG